MQSGTKFKQLSTLISYSTKKFGVLILMYMRMFTIKNPPCIWIEETGLNLYIFVTSLPIILFSCSKEETTCQPNTVLILIDYEQV